MKKVITIPEEQTVQLKQQIHQRCSWRRYTDQVVADDLLDTILKKVEFINNAQKSFKVIHISDQQNILAPLLVQLIRGAKHILVFEVLDEANRPQTDVLMGLLGELLILDITKLKLGSIWLGGDKFAFSSEKIRKRLGSENDFPVVIPFGHPVDPSVSIRNRKKIGALAPSWPQDQVELFELINRAPSAINRQPYKLELLGKQVKITVNNPSYKKGNYMSHWLDAGIASAHACVALPASYIGIDGDSVVIKQNK